MARIRVMIRCVDADCSWWGTRSPSRATKAPCPTCGAEVALRPRIRAPRGLPLRERLLFHAHGAGPSTCWRWTGSINPNGYGQITVNGKTRLVHRASYEVFIGPIPEGMQVDHVRSRGCRHKNCFNPAHLEAVTPQVNTQRAPSGQAAKTHCPQGHPYAGDNLFFNSTNGGRSCRTCQRSRRKKAA